MDQNNSLQPKQPTDAASANPPANQVPQKTESSPIPASTESQPKKSFLKNPLFWIVIIFLLIFAGAYYFIYSNLENKVTQLTQERKIANKVITTPIPATSYKNYTEQDNTFSLTYPSEIELNKYDQKSGVNLQIFVNPIKGLDAPMGYDEKTAHIDIPQLQKGMFGERIDWPLESSKKVINLDRTYAKAFTVLGRFDVCDVAFDRILVFYSNGKSIRITLSGDKNAIIGSMPEYFMTDPSSCGDEKVWKRDGATQRFYQALAEGKGSGPAQSWFDSFDKIVASIKIN